MQNGWLKGKVIVIIGGTTGLGLAAAFRCIEEGGYVVVVGRDEERTRQAEEICIYKNNEHPGKYFFYMVLYQLLSAERKAKC